MPLDETYTFRDYYAKARDRVTQGWAQTRPSMPFVIKAAAATGATVLIANAADDIIKDYYNGKNPPLSHEMQTTDQGLAIRTPDGGLAFYQSVDYLKALKDLQATPQPNILDKPNEGSSTWAATLNTLTSPWTLLAVGGAIAIIVYAKRKK